MQKQLPIKKRHILRWKLHFPCYCLVKVSWNSILPFPRTVVSHLSTIFLADRWSQKFPNFSIVSFISVYGSKFTKFSTLVEQHEDCLPWKLAGGYSRKCWENRQKPGILHLYMQKRALCLPRGSKVKVEHTYYYYQQCHKLINKNQNDQQMHNFDKRYIIST